MTKVKMALALDKLIKDVKEEKILWNNNCSHAADEEESAWNRVATKNMLTGGEARSIFKVLCKKYRQEAQKSYSSWQLFDSLKFLDEKNAEDASIKAETNDQTPTSPSSNHEEETFVELLEVKDEDFSDDESSSSSPSKDSKSTEDIKEVNTNLTLLNNEVNNKITIKSSIEKQHSNSQKNENHHNNSNGTINEKNHETPPPPSHRLSGVTITKKEKDHNNTTTTTSNSPIVNALKRKYSSDANHQRHNNTHQKEERSSSDTQHEYQQDSKRRIIKTSSSSSNSQSVLNSQHQKQSQNNQDFIKNTTNDVKTLNVSKDIVEAITNNKILPQSQTIMGNNNNDTSNTNEMNDETFMKYSSFGSYVATTMNRLSPKLAAKLEIKILQAIIDVNSEMINRF